MLMTIQQPEAETRFHIAKKLAQRESVNLPDDVAMILANNIDGNLRRLRGAIIKLIVHSSVYTTRIDISLASMILQSFTSSSAVPSSQKPIDQIYDAIEHVMKISREDIKGNNRSKEIVLARQLVMYILKQHFGKQVVEIARDTGKQHPTVIHSIKKIDKSVMMEGAAPRYLRRSDRPAFIKVAAVLTEPRASFPIPAKRSITFCKLPDHIFDRGIGYV